MSALLTLQSPLRERYAQTPDAALVTLRAQSLLDGDGFVCSVATGRTLVEAGLHESVGGTGLQVCSGDMLLQALAACAGVTLRSVADVLGIEIRGGEVEVSGQIDVRGTLAMDANAKVGFGEIKVHFHLDTDAPVDQLAALVAITEQCCVVYQTLSVPARLSASVTAPVPSGSSEVHGP